MSVDLLGVPTALAEASSRDVLARGGDGRAAAVDAAGRILVELERVCAELRREVRLEHGPMHEALARGLSAESERRMADEAARRAGVDARVVSARRAMISAAMVLVAKSSGRKFSKLAEAVVRCADEYVMRTLSAVGSGESKRLLGVLEEEDGGVDADGVAVELVADDAEWRVAPGGPRGLREGLRW